MTGMKRFHFDEEKATEMIVHILNKTETCDITNLMNICYLVDLHHLKNYGRPITGNAYTKLNNGVRVVEVEIVVELSLLTNKVITLKDGALCATREADLMKLSKSDLECMNHITNSFHTMTKSKLSNECCGIAWQSVEYHAEIKLEHLLNEIGDESLTNYLLKGD
ncbi:conserved hypothetical protein [Vibrio chagasii]|nr:conserved hypothetical protein [Vibrio chagasii]